MTAEEMASVVRKRFRLMKEDHELDPKNPKPVWNEVVYQVARENYPDDVGSTVSEIQIANAKHKRERRFGSWGRRAS